MTGKALGFDFSRKQAAAGRKPVPLLYLISVVAPTIVGVALGFAVAQWQIATSPSVALFTDEPHRTSTAAIMGAALSFVVIVGVTTYLGWRPG
jgi:hypothetical protein